MGALVEPAGYDPAELLGRTREYVERAAVVDPEAGFSLSDIAAPAEWQAVLSSVVGPAVISEAVTGAVLALLTGGLTDLGAFKLLDLPALPRVSVSVVWTRFVGVEWLQLPTRRAVVSEISGPT